MVIYRMLFFAMLIIFRQHNVFYFKFESTLLIFHKQNAW